MWVIKKTNTKNGNHYRESLDVGYHDPHCVFHTYRHFELNEQSEAEKLCNYLNGGLVVLPEDVKTRVTGIVEEYIKNQKE